MSDKTNWTKAGFYLTIVIWLIGLTYKAIWSTAQLENRMTTIESYGSPGTKVQLSICQTQLNDMQDDIRRHEAMLSQHILNDAVIQHDLESRLRNKR